MKNVIYMRKKKVPINVKERKELIVKTLNKETINWPKEMKIADKILKDLTDLEFWKIFNLGYKMDSLAFLLTNAGRLIIDKQYAEYKLKNQEPNLPINPTQDLAPRGLKEFIN